MLRADTGGSAVGAHLPPTCRRKIKERGKKSKISEENSPLISKAP